jgi:nucleotide-binding universal stress UspA family protein
MATIVIGTDGSQASRDAAELGLQFAEARGDRVVIVTAWPPVHDLGITDTIFDVDLMDFLHGRARRIVDEAAARASLRGLEVETVVAPGMPADEICRVAIERGAELIVVGAHGWGPIHGLMRGSVTNAVLHRAPCAVLAGPPEPREAPSNPAGQLATRTSDEGS